MSYFKKEEFACKCCGENKIDDSLIAKLEVARGLAHTPFVITSGYRCEKHNKRVGGKANSSHLRGLAVDILAQDSVARFKIMKALLDAGFKRVGFADTFIHVDVDSSLAQEVMWKY